MSDTSSGPHDAVAELRAALRATDRVAIARGLQRVPVAIGLDGAQPRIAIDGTRRLLPVFLDMDSWTTFALPGKPLLLDAEKLLALLEALTHVDDVLVDPALASAMRLPRVDLVQLLSSTPGAGAEPANSDQDQAGRAPAARQRARNDRDRAPEEE